MNLRQTKVAARAGVRDLAERYRQPGLSPSGYNENEDYARENLRAMMVGRNLPLGSQVRALGAGGEGITTQNLHPGALQMRLREDPLAARKPGSFSANPGAARENYLATANVNATPSYSKTFEPTQHPTMAMPVNPGSYAMKIYDPTSQLYNPEIQKNRASLVGTEMPGYSKIHGFGQAGKRVVGLPTDAMISDLVPGREGDWSVRNDVRQKYLNPPAGMRNRGLGAEDVRIGNTIIDNRTGKPTVIDYMPISQKDRIPGFEPARGESHYVTQGIVPGSPTDKAFRYQTNPTSTTMGALVGRREDLKGPPNPLDGLRALLAKPPTFEERMKRRAQVSAEIKPREKNYGGQLLKSFYTGENPTPFKSKIPVPSIAALGKVRANDALAGIQNAGNRLMGLFRR